MGGVQELRCARAAERGSEGEACGPRESGVCLCGSEEVE